MQHARMVMRQNGNLRLLLNAAVYPGMPVQFMTGNVGVTFGVVNAAAPHDVSWPNSHLLCFDTCNVL